MTLFRYAAIAPGSAPSRGEIAAESPAEARAALRRVGLRVLSLRAPRPTLPRGPLSAALSNHLRRRRTSIKADLLEDLATLLDTGVPLVDAAATLAGSAAEGGRARRRLMRAVRDGLRDGGDLSASMRAHPAWFDGVDAAMADAGEHAGTLPDVLRALAARHARSDELAQRIAAALAYPLIVLTIGIAVAIFLSVTTLPKLADVLQQSKVPVPALTRGLIAAGGHAITLWPVALLAAAALAAATITLRRRVARGGLRLPRPLRRLVPAAVRRAALAGVLRELGALLRCGVPLVDALRVAAPTASGPGAPSLQALLIAAAAEVESGRDLSDALADPLWFGESLRRSIHVGEASGELPSLLDRLADAEARRARRLADRLATLLEPAAILLVAALVGLVVMAAVQPLIHLQEVIR